MYSFNTSPVLITNRTQFDSEPELRMGREIYTGFSSTVIKKDHVQPGLPIAYSFGGEFSESLFPCHQTLVQALRFNAATLPSSRGITYVDSTKKPVFESYSQLLQEAEKLSQRLRNKGITKGDTLIMQIEDRRTHIHAIWACLLAGIIPLNISVPSVYSKDNAVFLKLDGVVKQIGARNI